MEKKVVRKSARKVVEEVPDESESDESESDEDDEEDEEELDDDIMTSGSEAE